MTRHCYELSGFRFALTANSPPAGIPLWSLYPALRSRPGPCDAEWTVSRVRASGPLYALRDQHGEVYETDDPVRLMEHLEWAILLALLAAQDHFLQLHAAGIVRDDRGLLLVGPSGSGKSTHALGMLLAGFRCLSDEIILLEPDGSMAWPFPRSFHAKADTLRLFPELRRPDAGSGFADSSGKARFDPAVIRKDWVSRPARPAWLVFPRYNPAGGDELQPLGETEALSMMIEQAINLTSFGQGGIEVLIRLVRSCECYRLGASDVKRACTLLSELTDVRCGEEALA